MPLPSKVSNATRRLNPHLFDQIVQNETDQRPKFGLEAPKHRLRQLQDDGLNKLERRFLAHLKTLYDPSSIKPHGITLRLANGVRYTPDFLVEPMGPMTSVPMLFEVKGRMAWDDAIVKIKVAASQTRWMWFYLCSEQPDHTWFNQRMVP